MDYGDWGLSVRFPPRDNAQREWEALKRQLAVGGSVTGVVIGRAPFGAWIDIGVGFPALLEITVMAGLTPERYRVGDWCPVGSEISAEVSMFQDENRQIYLGQVKSHGAA
jgi:ribosomal protein S1